MGHVPRTVTLEYSSERPAKTTEVDRKALSGVRELVVQVLEATRHVVRRGLDERHHLLRAVRGEAVRPPTEEVRPVAVAVGAAAW